MVAYAEPDTVTLEQAATISGKSQRTIERWIAGGGLPSTKVLAGDGREERRIARADLERKLGAGLPEARPLDGGARQMWMSVGGEGMSVDDDVVIEQAASATAPVASTDTQRVFMALLSDGIRASVSSAVAPFASDNAEARARLDAVLSESAALRERVGRAEQRADIAEMRLRKMSQHPIGRFIVV